MNLFRLLAFAVLYVVVNLVMDLYRTGGSLSVDSHDLLGRAAAAVVFAALFEVLSPLTGKWAGKGRGR